MSGIEIRAARPEDRAAIESVVDAAFGDDGGQVVRLVRALDASGASRSSLVAVDTDVIGHVQLSRGWIDTRPQLVEVLVLSPLSVAPRHQRRGVGTALVEASVAEADRLAAPAVFLEGDWNYYGAHGFAAATDHGFDRPSPRIPQPAFQVVLLPRHEEWMVGRLIYPEAFWANDAVGLRDPRLAELEARLRYPR